MKITRLTNSFKLENEGTITQHALNSVTAYIGQSRDSVTFRDVKENIGSAPVSAITVDGVQMTSDNIEELLSPIFENRVNNNLESGNGSQSIQDAIYTIADYSEPLVFPTPSRTGHIVEYYKDSNLERSYQWNGWDWLILGAEPNLIFTQSKSLNSVLGENALYKSKDGDQVLLTLEKDGKYSDVRISVTKVDLISKDYTLGEFALRSLKEDSIITVSDVKAESFNIMSENNDDIKEYVSINNCEAYSLNIYLTAKKIILDNLSLTDNGYASYNLSGEDINITNSLPKTIDIYIIQPDTTKRGKSIINIANNNLNNIDNYNSLRVNLGSDVVTDCDLVIDNNSGLKELNISGISGDSIIKSFTGNFDECIERVYLYNLNFEQSAFDDLINALIAAPLSTGEERSFGIYDVLPGLTDDQKTALIDKGWNIE